MKNKLILSVLSILIIFSCFIGCTKDTPTQSLETGTLENTPLPRLDLSNKKIGDYVTLGKYEQDNNEANGAEDIEWLIVDSQKGKMLVVSKYILDSKKYNEGKGDTTWESCSLREWLNINFMDIAFNDAEKGYIGELLVRAENNKTDNVSGGNNTLDYVFILSKGQIEQYFPTAEERKCAPTEYALSQGASTGNNKSAGWWTRTPGISQSESYHIDQNGEPASIETDASTNGIRPAMWIYIEY